MTKRIGKDTKSSSVVRKKFVLSSCVIMSFLTLAINGSDMHGVPIMQANERLPMVQSHTIPVNESPNVVGNQNDIGAINNTTALSTQAMTAVSNMVDNYKQEYKKINNGEMRGAC